MSNSHEFWDIPSLRQTHTAKIWKLLEFVVTFVPKIILAMVRNRSFVQKTTPPPFPSPWVCRKNEAKRAGVKIWNPKIPFPWFVIPVKIKIDQDSNFGNELNKWLRKYRSVQIWDLFIAFFSILNYISLSSPFSRHKLVDNQEPTHRLPCFRSHIAACSQLSMQGLLAARGCSIGKAQGKTSHGKSRGFLGKIINGSFSISMLNYWRLPHSMVNKKSCSDFCCHRSCLIKQSNNPWIKGISSFESILDVWLGSSA